MNIDVVPLVQDLVIVVFRFKKSPRLPPNSYPTVRIRSSKRLQDVRLSVFCVVSLCSQVPVQMTGVPTRRSPVIQDGEKRRIEGWRRGKRRRWACCPNCRTTDRVARRTPTKVAPTLRTVSLFILDWKRREKLLFCVLKQKTLTICEPSHHKAASLMVMTSLKVSHWAPFVI